MSCTPSSLKRLSIASTCLFSLVATTVFANTADAAPVRDPRLRITSIPGSHSGSDTGTTPTDPYTAINGSSPYTLSAAQKRQAAALAGRIVANMTFAQKAAYVGTSLFGALPDFKVPMLVSSEGTDGVSATSAPAIGYPSAISLAATWDPAMAAGRGLELARDAQAGGVQLVNGPGLNMARTPYGGREAEFVAGEDPILGAIMGTAYVEGQQSAGVMAELKHIFANDQESNRGNINETVDSRALHELYEVPFEAAVKIAQPAAVMCAFPSVNGVHNCENKSQNVGMVEGQWGFDGFIQSDFGAIFNVGPALSAHTAIDASGGFAYTAASIQAAIAAGTTTEADLDRAVTQVIKQLLYFKMGQNVGTPTTRTEPDRPEGSQFAEQEAEEGVVLLKNSNANLPLSSSVRSIAVLGAFADQPAPRPVGSGFSPYRHYVSELAGLRAAAPAGTTIDLIQDNTLDPAHAATVSGWQASYWSTPNWQGYPVQQNTESAINFNWQSGTVEPGCSPGSTCGSAVWTSEIKPTITGDYVFKVHGNGQMQVLINGNRILVTNDSPTSGSNGLDMTRAAFAKFTMIAGQTYAVTVTYSSESYWAPYLGGIVGAQFSYAALSPSPALKKYDAVIVSGGFGGEYEGEGIDRDFTLPEYQSQLIDNVARVNPHTTALIYSSGAADMRDFNSDIASLAYVWYPGQEGGTAIANLLFGKSSPSGKLPVTIDSDVSNNLAARNFPMPLNADFTNGTLQLPYYEGVYTGYRGYDLSGATPLYAFGSGLSYTTFSYSNLSLAFGTYQGQPSVEVGFDVANTGKTDGAEVAQVYVSEPKAPVDRPAKELKGFKRETIKAGSTKHFLVHLPYRAFARYDADHDRWKIDASLFTVRVGGASDKLVLSQSYNNPTALTLQPSSSVPIFDPGFKQ